MSGVGEVSVKRTYPTSDRGLTHLFECSLHSVRLVMSVTAPVELSTRYTTPDTTVKIVYECDRGIRTQSNDFTNDANIVQCQTAICM